MKKSLLLSALLLSGLAMTSCCGGQKCEEELQAEYHQRIADRFIDVYMDETKDFIKAANKAQNAEEYTKLKQAYNERMAYESKTYNRDWLGNLSWKKYKEFCDFEKENEPMLDSLRKKFNVSSWDLD